LLLTKYFGMSEGYFLRMQGAYDLRLAKRKLGRRLASVVPVFNLAKWVGVKKK